MKKYLLLIVALLCCAVTHAEQFPYNDSNGIQKDNEYYANSPVDMGDKLKEFNTDDETSLLQQFLRMYGLEKYEGKDKAIRYVKGIVNLTLSLVSLVALVWLIYGFYMMFFSSEDEGIARARKIIKMVVIALLLIGLSRLLTSFLFFIYYRITGGV